MRQYTPSLHSFKPGPSWSIWFVFPAATPHWSSKRRASLVAPNESSSKHIYRRPPAHAGRPNRLEKARAAGIGKLVTPGELSVHTNMRDGNINIPSRWGRVKDRLINIPCPYLIRITKTNRPHIHVWQGDLNHGTP